MEAETLLMQKIQEQFSARRQLVPDIVGTPLSMEASMNIAAPAYRYRHP